jgi:phenol/toluene 2-monooxygenase (NADH) P3/A3
MTQQATAEYNRTKRLYWEPSYVPKEAIYPPANYEGIYFKDWDRWDDPFQMSFKQYVEIQAKKDNGFHPARDAFDRYGGTERMDPRWVEGMKVVYPILFHGEYGALRSNARVSRYAPAPALRAAAFYQSIDELRHSQNHVYQLRMFNKHTEGFHNWAEWKRHHFLLQPAKMLFEDIVACENVFESVMGLNILVEVAYTNLVFVGIPSVGVLNGDLAGASEFLTTQSDETRHMAIGQSTLRTLLEGDDRNLEKIQYWLDKWFWLLHRIIGCPLGVIPDYFAKKKALPMRQMFQRYIVDNYVAGMVEDLGDLGLQPPRFLDDAVREMEDAPHALPVQAHAVQQDVRADRAGHGVLRRALPALGGAPRRLLGGGPGRRPQGPALAADALPGVPAALRLPRPREPNDPVLRMER